LEPTGFIKQVPPTAAASIRTVPIAGATPREYYEFKMEESLQNRIGSVSIPTLESIHGMMPEKDWEMINDDWAEHDLAHVRAEGDVYPKMIGERYGKVSQSGRLCSQSAACGL